MTSVVRSLCGEGSRSSVERGAGHAEVSNDLRGGCACGDEAQRTLDLAVCDALGASVEVVAGGASLGDGVNDALSLGRRAGRSGERRADDGIRRGFGRCENYRIAGEEKCLAVAAVDLVRQIRSARAVLCEPGAVVRGELSD